MDKGVVKSRMIPFIFFIIVIIFILLIFSFIIQSYPLALISAMALIVIGVDILANGIRGIENILTLGLGTIFVCFGAYIFINGSLEQLKEINYGGIKW